MKIIEKILNKQNSKANCSFEKRKTELEELMEKYEYQKEENSKKEDRNRELKRQIEQRDNEISILKNKLEEAEKIVKEVCDGREITWTKSNTRNKTRSLRKN